MVLLRFVVAICCFRSLLTVNWICCVNAAHARGISSVARRTRNPLRKSSCVATTTVHSSYQCGCGATFKEASDAAAPVRNFSHFSLGFALLLVCNITSQPSLSFASFCTMPKCALLSVLAALMLPQLAQGHGYITNPQARSFNPNDGFYDDQAGNGAGSPVRFNPAPGICGDPFQDHASTNFAGTVGPIRGKAHAHLRKSSFSAITKVCASGARICTLRLSLACFGAACCWHSMCCLALVHRVVNVAPQPFMLH
jgi:hypothetical protein